MKKSVIGLLVLLILVVSISFVSAGFGNWLNNFFSIGNDDKELGGELANLKSRGDSIDAEGFEDLYQPYSWSFSRTPSDPENHYLTEDFGGADFIPTGVVEYNEKGSSAVLKTGTLVASNDKLGGIKNREFFLDLCIKADNIGTVSNGNFLEKKLTTLNRRERSTTGFSLGYHKNNKILSAFLNGNVNCNNIPLADGKWHAIALTAGKNNRGYLIDLYFDGHLCNSASIRGPIKLKSTRDLSISTRGIGQLELGELVIDSWNYEDFPDWMEEIYRGLNIQDSFSSCNDRNTINEDPELECEDECDAFGYDGEIVCVDSRSYKLCNNGYDNDVCLDLSSPRNCPPGKRCSNDACV